MTDNHIHRDDAPENLDDPRSGPVSITPPGRRLRIMTFNIHHGEGPDGRLDLERVARTIEDGNPDVVGLQEVDQHFSARSQFVDQPFWLAQRLGMRGIFGANLDADPLEPGRPRRRYGTALLSRFPIQQWHNIPLPRIGMSEQRGLMCARIDVDGIPVRIYNTHLQFNSSLERASQAAAIRKIIDAVPEPTILVGDLNASPQDPEIADITQTLVDVWPRVGEGAGYTYDSTAPFLRIDYVLTSPDVTPYAATVVASDASDHLPVIVDLAVPASL